MRLIDADYLKDRLNLLENTATLTLGERCIMWRILEVINKMPTEAEPVKHGRWIPVDLDKYNFATEWRCSECDKDVFVTWYGNECDYGYCPNCGARMNLGEEDEQER